MARYSIYALGASQIGVSNGVSLSGVTQGDASQLNGQTITLDSNAWEEIEIKDNETRFADNDGGQRLGGAQSFDGVSYGNNTVIEAEYRVVVSDGTNEYTLIGFNLNEPGQGPSYGTVEGLAFLDSFPPVGVPLTVISTGEGPSNGSNGNSTEAETYATPPCFASGTLIETPDGPRAVETLKLGDRVSTRDSGSAPIRWTGSVTIGPDRLAAQPSLRPVRIRAGALGRDLPRRDLLLSQQHRVLLQGAPLALTLGIEEALGAAIHLVGRAGVSIERTATAVTYHHILFDRHEIVFSEGLPTESFLPGPAVMPSVTDEARAELIELFPELADGLPSGLAPARPILRAFEVGVLVA